MNVGQLESALGMSRANIRFYEKEKLLSPARSENGYRDYSDRDLETLRRIKLLRSLRFSLEEIKALQSGALDLSDALRAQSERLRREAGDLEAARTLCRAMEEERVGYADLDAARYLAEMARLEREGSRFQSVAADALPTVRHPWRRYFARGLDLGLCRFLLEGILGLYFRVRHGDGLLWDVALLYLTWGVAFLLEPLLLSTWGFTPGKRLFGLEVRNADGGKLTFTQALTRLALLFRWGEGWGIPVYSLIRNCKSFAACEDGEVLPWEEGLSYTIRDLKAVRCAGCAAAACAQFALAALLALHMQMPPVRRPLTVADFARNFNDACRQYDLESDGLNGDGTRRRPAPIDAALRLSGGPWDPEYVLREDGVLEEVTFVYHGDPAFYHPLAQPVGVVFALLAAQPDVDLFTWRGAYGQLLHRMGHFYEDYSFTAHGLTVTNTVEYSGYEPYGGGELLPVEGEVQSYHRAFSVRIDTAA